MSNPVLAIAHGQSKLHSVHPEDRALLGSNLSAVVNSNTAGLRRRESPRPACCGIDGKAKNPRGSGTESPSRSLIKPKLKPAAKSALAFSLNRRFSLNQYTDDPAVTPDQDRYARLSILRCRPTRPGRRRPALLSAAMAAGLVGGYGGFAAVADRRSAGHHARCCRAPSGLEEEAEVRGMILTLGTVAFLSVGSTGLAAEPAVLDTDALRQLRGAQRRGHHRRSAARLRE